MGGVKKSSRYILFDEDSNPYSSFNMCYLNALLGKAALAEAFEAVPVFDVKNLDGVNLYDVFFEQKEVENRIRILDSPRYNNAKKYISGPSFQVVYNAKMLMYWKGVFDRNFLLKPQIAEVFHMTYKRIMEKVPDGYYLIGIEYRGTDYRTLKPKGHPRQPSINDIFKFIRDNELEKQYFFLSTDEETALKQFRKKYGTHIFAVERAYYDKEFYDVHNDYSYVTQVRFDRKNDCFLQGYEYFREVYVLSKCDGIIGSNCGASRMAAIINGGNYMVNGIFSLGEYE